MPRGGLHLRPQGLNCLLVIHLCWLTQEPFCPRVPFPSGVTYRITTT